MKRVGWFSDYDNDPDLSGGMAEYRWQPCLETGTGHIPSFDVHFKSKDECDTWIREYVIGAAWLDE